MPASIDSRPDQGRLARFATVVMLAGSVLAGCSLGGDDAGRDRAPAGGDVPVADEPEVPRLPGPTASEPDDGGADGDPAGPGPLEPGERPRPWTRGDDADLDALWERCAAADGSACDELFDSAPLGSDYERFGLTCGDRDDIADCSELLPAGGG